MYLLVNQVIQDIIYEYHGEENWEIFKQKTEIEDIGF